MRCGPTKTNGNVGASATVRRLSRSPAEGKTRWRSDLSWLWSTLWPLQVHTHTREADGLWSYAIHKPHAAAIRLQQIDLYRCWAKNISWWWECIVLLYLYFATIPSEMCLAVRSNNCLWQSVRATSSISTLEYYIVELCLIQHASLSVSSIRIIRHAEWNSEGNRKIAVLNINIIKVYEQMRIIWFIYKYNFIKICFQHNANNALW